MVVKQHRLTLQRMVCKLKTIRISYKDGSDIAVFLDSAIVELQEILKLKEPEGKRLRPEDASQIMILSGFGWGPTKIARLVDFNVASVRRLIRRMKHPAR